MRLIDAEKFENYVFDEWQKNEISNGDWITFREWLKGQETVIEFDGEVNKVVVRGVEYVKPTAGVWTREDCHAATYPYCCSNCKAHHRALYDFCPTCGADMRGNNAD